jgi:ribosome-binding ATPase YchF (GTP1/OBG family)
MKIKIGLCGLPNSGKSTFIKLVSQVEVLIAPYPFTTLKAQEYAVPIISQELKTLYSITQTPQPASRQGGLIPPYLIFVDVPGLIRGAHKGEGLGNEFLSYLRGCDVILEIVRNFKREDVPHPEGSIDPLRDIKIIEEEVRLSDEEILQRAKKGRVPPEALLLNKDWFLLMNGENTNMTQIEKELDINRFKNIYTLDLLWELEILENKEIQNEFQPKVFEFLNQFRKDLGLIQDSSIIEAAEMIHSDFALKFKVAETISLENFVKIKDWEKAKKLGLIQNKGREAKIEENEIIFVKI